MKKTILLIAVAFLCITAAQAQDGKRTVYGEVGFGFGQTLFFGNMTNNLVQSYGGSFKPGVGYNLLMGFYVAPDRWRGLGVGARMKGTFGTSVKGDFDDSYIFNYYNASITAKHYLFSLTFNKGIYARSGVGFGQFTTKRVNEATKLYKHQYALGVSLQGGVGYTWQRKNTAISVEAEFEYATRGGTADGIGDLQYQTGQIGINALIAF